MIRLCLLLLLLLLLRLLFSRPKKIPERESLVHFKYVFALCYSLAFFLFFLFLNENSLMFGEVLFSNSTQESIADLLCSDKTLSLSPFFLPSISLNHSLPFWFEENILPITPLSLSLSPSVKTLEKQCNHSEHVSYFFSPSNLLDRLSLFFFFLSLPFSLHLLPSLSTLCVILLFL